MECGYCYQLTGYVPWGHRLCDGYISFFIVLGKNGDKRMRCEGDPTKTIIYNRAEADTPRLLHCRVPGTLWVFLSSKERTGTCRLHLWFWYWPTIWPVFELLILSFLTDKTELSISASVGCFTEQMESRKGGRLASHPDAWHRGSARSELTGKLKARNSWYGPKTN